MKILDVDANMQDYTRQSKRGKKIKKRKRKGKRLEIHSIERTQD